MRTRNYLQENRKDMGTSGTLSFNLDYTDPITEMTILLEATNGATSNRDNPPPVNVSKIEIVDGGEVLWDLSGPVAVGMEAALQGGILHSYWDAMPNGTPYMEIPIRFGRYLYDPLFAFNPVGHKNPQIKITFDEATTRAAGATGYVTDSFNLSLMVKIMEQAENPIGFLSCREISSFTSLASGDARVELPTDKVIRNVVYRIYEAGNDYRSNIDRMKLSADGGKFIPFDLYTRNLATLHSEHFSPVTVPLFSLFDLAGYEESWVALDLTGSIVAQNEDYAISCSVFWPARYRSYPWFHDGTGSSNIAGYANVLGWGVFNTFLYPFGDINNPEHWFNPADIRNLDLFLTQANAGALVEVCLQSVYPY